MSIKGKENISSLYGIITIAFYQKAMNYLKEGLYFDCLKILEKLSKFNPNYNKIYVTKAVIFSLILKDQQKALEELDIAISRHPDSKELASIKKMILQLKYSQNVNYIYI